MALPAVFSGQPTQKRAPQACSGTQEQVRQVGAEAIYLAPQRRQLLAAVAAYSAALAMLRPGVAAISLAETMHPIHLARHRLQLALLVSPKVCLATRPARTTLQAYLGVLVTAEVVQVRRQSSNHLLPVAKQQACSVIHPAAPVVGSETRKTVAAVQPQVQMLPALRLPHKPAVVGFLARNSNPQPLLLPRSSLSRPRPLVQHLLLAARPPRRLNNRRSRVRRLVSSAVMLPRQRQRREACSKI